MSSIKARASSVASLTALFFRSLVFPAIGNAATRSSPHAHLASTTAPRLSPVSRLLIMQRKQSLTVPVTRRMLSSGNASDRRASDRGIEEQLSMAANIVAHKTWNGINLEELIRIRDEAIRREEARKSALGTEVVLEEGPRNAAKFYKPLYVARNEKLVDVTDDEVVGEAGTLVMFGITTRSEKRMMDELCVLARLTHSPTPAHFNRAAKGGVVVCTPTSSIANLNIRTLNWLIEPKLELIGPEIVEIYDKFVKPKLFRDGKLRKPTDFRGFNLIGISFANRGFDALCGYMHEQITAAGGNSSDYLRNVYQLCLAANPYNWLSWRDKSPWMKAVLENVPSDTVYSAGDCATRPPREIMPLIHNGFYEGHLLHTLEGTQRCLRLVNARFTGNSYGHGAAQIVDALSAIHPAHYKMLADYLKGGIFSEEFYVYRAASGKKFDPSNQKWPEYEGNPHNITNLYPAQEAFIQLREQMLRAEMLLSPDSPLYRTKPETHLSIWGGSGPPAKYIDTQDRSLRSHVDRVKREEAEEDKYQGRQD